MGDMNLSPAQLMQLARQMKAMRMNQAGQVEQLAQQGISEEQQAQLHEVMRDKAKLSQMLSSPQAQELLQKLGGKQAD